MTRAASTRGFTLIEMMVALVIFAMIAAAGVALLSFGVRAQGAATVALDDSAAQRRLSVLLGNDLAQIVPRPVRGTDGNTLRAFTGGDGNGDTSGDALIMSYVRGGWSNPDGLRRASLQRVNITLAGGRLARSVYTALDGGVPGAGVVMADHVTKLAMRYRDFDGHWVPRWDNPALLSLPAAVEMTITRRDHPPLVFAWAASTRYP